jgi:hypothetical protein
LTWHAFFFLLLASLITLIDSIRMSACFGAKVWKVADPWDTCLVPPECSSFMVGEGNCPHADSAAVAVCAAHMIQKIIEGDGDVGDSPDDIARLANAGKNVFLYHQHIMQHSQYRFLQSISCSYIQVHAACTTCFFSWGMFLVLLVPKTECTTPFLTPPSASLHRILTFSFSYICVYTFSTASTYFHSKPSFRSLRHCIAHSPLPKAITLLLNTLLTLNPPVRARQQARAESSGETDATPAAVAADAAASAVGGRLLAALRVSIAAVRARLLKPEDRCHSRPQNSSRKNVFI